jgi:hypothetical protein
VPYTTEGSPGMPQLMICWLQTILLNLNLNYTMWCFAVTASHCTTSLHKTTDSECADTLSIIKRIPR